MRRIHDVDVLGALSTHSTTTSKIIWAAESKAPRPLESSIGHDECRNPYGV